MDDARFLQYSGPAFRSVVADANVLGQVMDVEDVSNPACRCPDEIEELEIAGDRDDFLHVPFDVRLRITGIKDITIRVPAADERRHGTAEDASIDFMLGQRRHGEDRTVADKGLLYKFHQVEGLGARQTKGTGRAPQVSEMLSFFSFTIELSETQTGAYQNAYCIPKTGGGTIEKDNWNIDMFDNTGGTFTGSPVINTTYHTSNTIIQ